MEEQIMAILNDICGAQDGELEADLNLFDAGLLDSFGVVQLLVALETHFNIILDIETLSREEISTPSRMIQRIKQAL